MFYQCFIVSVENVHRFAAIIRPPRYRCHFYGTSKSSYCKHRETQLNLLIQKEGEKYEIIPKILFVFKPTARN